ncbi:hypothetical protein NA57DRAFT_64429 [Rhizodiscina lignyota]|uniref:Altered inheritance of mitochondria protein 24, mitochondrial n=1 Tax=Rhizodiscina lignyota TaxID=1504668 RepID=A0A9P4MDJ8_9PEZI|nr:hypothetical protein NA57DRAFT_64429 [Rhizodiscina lignyota]
MRRRPFQAFGSCVAPKPSCLARSISIRSSIPRRYAQVQAAPSYSADAADNFSNDDVNPLPVSPPDAQFEVLGHPYSLLSVKLSPSQNLYTRRGSLVAVSGKPDDAVSTLSVLGPLRRSALGIPFLYQRISSTSPMTALLSTKSAISSFSVIHLDGRIDWIVAQRSGLLAWSGHTLSVSPRANTKMSLAHWGNSHITGRGLVALVGKGQIYQINLKANEQYIAHPSNVLAYTINQIPPLPFRFKSTTLRLQIPDISSWLPDTRFFRVMRESTAWKSIAAFLFSLRTWTRRTIWGDRLFLQFQGPMTILLQSRASGLTDSLTNRDVNEIADTPAGAVQDAVVLDLKAESRAASSVTPTAPPASPTAEQPAKMRMATVRGGKVSFQDS